MVILNNYWKTSEKNYWRIVYVIWCCQDRFYVWESWFIMCKEWINRVSCFRQEIAEFILINDVFYNYLTNGHNIIRLHIIWLWKLFNFLFKNVLFHTHWSFEILLDFYDILKNRKNENGVKSYIFFYWDAQIFANIKSF